jgi:MFS family permease
VGSFGVGVLLFGIDTYVPLFIQGVRGGSATEAGWALTPMFCAWAISVFVSVRFAITFGFRATAMAGGAVILLGMVGLTCGVIRPEWSRPLFFVAMIIIGLGFGPLSLCFILSTQNSVAWDRRGVATGAVTFVRTMGGALGVGFLGATLGFELARRLIAEGAGSIDVAAALRPETHALLSPGQLELVQAALGRSLRDVFLQMIGVAVLTILAASRLAGGKAKDASDSGSGFSRQEDLALAAMAE